jgi:hypothetical protein
MASMSGTAWMRPAFACGMLAVTLLTPIRTGAQDLTSSQLKAAFIYNFIKFTEWPIVLPASDPFVICVIGDANVGEAVEAMIKGRDIDGHRIVALVKISRPTPACQVLYVSGATLEDATRPIAGLQNTPVLTISDVAGFAQTGGMAQFLFERGRLRFTINAASVQRSGLKMSSKLLVLGQR